MFHRAGTLYLPDILICKMKKKTFFISFLAAVTIGLLIYTIFTDGPDIVRGTKSIKTLSIFSKK